mgnify:CR=1 FL=1
MHKLAKGVTSWLENWQLVDVWRLQHEKEKEYSYYSSVHNVHVRLERIVCSRNLCSMFVASEYLGCTYLDHNPLKVRFGDENRPSPIPQWRLQPTTLGDPVFREELAADITEYFELNQGTASEV